MAQVENISDILTKSENKSLLHFMKLIDPTCQFGFDTLLIDAWNELTLTEQRKLYMYLLYRKWRGIPIFGEPFYIIRNCHPVPFNWNGQHGIQRMMKESKMVSAKYQGSFGIYSIEEARLYEMTDIKRLNY